MAPSDVRKRSAMTNYLAKGVWPLPGHVESTNAAAANAAGDSLFGIFGNFNLQSIFYEWQ